MNLSAHSSLAIFSALFFTLPSAVIVFFFQLFPLIDAALKKVFSWEPFHTLGFFILTSILVMLINFKLGVFASLSYLIHLISDVFVHEPLPFLWPFSKREFCFPVKHSERIVIGACLFGSLLFIILIIVR